MNVTIRKIGNSEGIIIPKDVLHRQGLEAGDHLTIVEDGDNLVLKRGPEDREAFERKMEIARQRMKKYEIALRELAK